MADEDRGGVHSASGAASALSSRVITLDTSAVLAAADPNDTHNRAALRTLESESGPLFIPAGILAEVAYMLEARLGQQAVVRFARDLEAASLVLDCGDRDLMRIRSLVEKYADLPLGFADASVVACGERRGGRVLAFDRRDLEIVGRDARIELLPHRLRKPVA